MSRLLKPTLFATAAFAALAFGNQAHAAVSAPLQPQAAASAPVTQIHWVWRHHHRFWVPDRRRDDHRDDRR